MHKRCNQCQIGLCFSIKIWHTKLFPNFNFIYYYIVVMNLYFQCIVIMRFHTHTSTIGYTSSDKSFSQTHMTNNSKILSRNFLVPPWKGCIFYVLYIVDFTIKSQVRKASRFQNVMCIFSDSFRIIYCKVFFCECCFDTYTHYLIFANPIWVLDKLEITKDIDS